jgi:hypothetical protein
MIRDSVWLQVSEKVPMIGICELCARDNVLLDSSVTVQHLRGGTLQFVACETCTRAMHRIAAAIGSEGQVAGTIMHELSEAPMEKPVSGSHPRPSVLSTELFLEVEDCIMAHDGRQYRARVYGGPKTDGMWSAWVEFVAVGTEEARRTGQETTQGSRADLVHWASSLGPAFFEGAFARAR